MEQVWGGPGGGVGAGIRLMSPFGLHHIVHLTLSRSIPPTSVSLQPLENSRSSKELTPTQIAIMELTRLQSTL